MDMFVYMLLQLYYYNRFYAIKSYKYKIFLPNHLNHKKDLVSHNYKTCKLNISAYKLS